MKFTNFITALSFCLLNAAPVYALEPIKGGEFTQLSDIALSKKSKQELEKFERARKGYGSFFVSRDGKSGAWFYGMFNQADVEKRARAVCEWRAKSKCIALGSLRPKNTVGDIAIPSRVRSNFVKMQRQTKSSHFGALAIYPLGGYGFGSDYGSAEGARERAILECQASAANERADLNPSLRKVFDAKKMYDCRIVYTFQKK